MRTSVEAVLATHTVKGGSSLSAESIMFGERSALRLTHDAGYVTTELLKMKGLGLTVGRVTSTGHKIELVEAENITFLLPRKGELGVAVCDEQHRLAAGQFYAFRPTERRTAARSSPRSVFVATTLQVSMTRVHTLATECDLDVNSTFGRDANVLSGKAGHRLGAHLRRLIDDIFLVPGATVPGRVVVEIANFIDGQICELMGGIDAQATSRRIVPAFHRVRQAEAIMYANSDDPLSIRDIAQSLSVSVRSLQLAFTEVHGHGPNQRLNRIRMEKARRRLLAARGDRQVTDIAMESGFSHLSRFAQTYARTYGERPSETLMKGCA